MPSANTFEIGPRKVGPGHRPFVIAEVAQAHDGSIDLAHSFIDAIADTGADAVKFQTHIAAAESTPHEPWRVRFSKRDESRYQYWQRMEFSETQWRGLHDHATKRGLVFLSSPFSPEAVDLLQRVGMPAWKVASGEMTNLPLLQKMAATGAPMLLSSGMSTLEELDQAVALCRDAKSPFAVLQCSTAYPCPPEKIGLNLLAELRQRFSCPVGLSDHSGQVYAGLAAAALGASVLEMHVTFSRNMFGPDAPASLTFPELKQLMKGVAAIHTMISVGVDKNALAKELEPLRRTFQKSVVARHVLARGTVLKATDLNLKKAGPGLPVSRLDSLVGRRLARDVAADAPLQETDLEN